MNTSGIIYPDSENEESISDISMVNDSEGLFMNNIIPSDDDTYLSTQTPVGSLDIDSQDEVFGIDSETTQNDYLHGETFTDSGDVSVTNKISGANENVRLLKRTDEVDSVTSEKKFINYTRSGQSNLTENNWEYDPSKFLVNKLRKSPYKSGPDTSRKFSSTDGFGSDGRDSFIDRDRFSRFAGKKETDTDTRTSEKNSSPGVKTSQNADRASTGSAGSSALKTRTEKVSNKAYEKSSDKSKKSEKQNREKPERSEGMLLSLMFVFEIFRWFLGTDVIVRFIVGAIAGVIGFGIIFGQLGSYGYF